MRTVHAFVVDSYRLHSASSLSIRARSGKAKPCASLIAAWAYLLRRFADSALVVLELASSAQPSSEPRHVAFAAWVLIDHFAEQEVLDSVAAAAAVEAGEVGVYRLVSQSRFVDWQQSQRRQHRVSSADSNSYSYSAATAGHSHPSSVFVVALALDLDFAFAFDLGSALASDLDLVLGVDLDPDLAFDLAVA